jgi:putative oxidoreductase
MLVLGVLDKPLLWFAEAAVCLPFIVSAIAKSMDRKAALEEMAAGGFPRSKLLLMAIVGTQAVSVALILLQLWPLVGAVLLTAFLAAATVKYHAFWRARGALRMTQLNHFAENIGLIGALLLVALVGARQ